MRAGVIEESRGGSTEFVGNCLIDLFGDVDVTVIFLMSKRLNVLLLTLLSFFCIFFLLIGFCEDHQFSSIEFVRLC